MIKKLIKLSKNLSWEKHEALNFLKRTSLFSSKISGKFILQVIPTAIYIRFNNSSENLKAFD